MTICPTCNFSYDPAASGGACPRCALTNALSVAASPQPIDDYVFLSELGRGAMGVVSLARQLSLDRLVAIKVIATGTRPAEWLEARLLREARAAAQLQHPHIVAVNEVGHGPAGAYLAMEYCEGGDLRARVRDHPLEPRAAAELVARLADGVAHAHAAGVLHRDLKPSNILLTAAGDPKISDFGLTTYTNATGELTQTGEAAGSPSYLAPETLRAGVAPAPAVDIYGLGAILYECVTGRPPFTGDSAARVLSQIAQAEPAAPRLLNRDVPADLETIILKCLEKNPASRYATALALRDDLRRFLAGRPILARPVSPLGRFVRWSRRNPALATACGVIVLGALAAALVLAERNFQLRRALARSSAAEAQARTALQASLLAQARATRESGRQGQRHETLRLVREAAALGAAPAAARTEALAALALEDWRWQVKLPRIPQLATSDRVDFSPDLSEYVIANADLSAPEIRRTSDQALVRALGRGGDRKLVSIAFGAQPGWISAIHEGEQQAVWAPGDHQPRWTYRPTQLDYASLRLADDGSGWWFTGPGHQVGWHDARTGAEHWIGAAGTRLYAITPSPDGRRLALVRDDRVEVWDLATEKLVWEWAGDVGWAPAAWSADGQWLFTDRWVGAPELVVWNARDGAVAQTLRRGQTRAISLAIHPDGRRLITVDGDAILRIWDRWTGHELVRGPAGYFVLRLAADGRRLAIGAAPQQLGILELADPSVAHSLLLQAPTVGLWRHAETSPDGRWLLSSTNQGAMLWSIASDREVLRQDFERDERAQAVFDPRDGSVIYSGLRAGVFRTPILAPQATPAWGEQQKLPALPRTLVRAISADSAHWWIEDYKREAGYHWAKGDPAQEQPIKAAADFGVVMPSPTGRWLAVSQPQDTGAGVVAWPEDKLVAKMPTTRPAIGTFSPDEKWLMFASADGYTAWKVGDWQAPAFRLPLEQAGVNQGAAIFSPDSQRVAYTTGLHTFAVAATGRWQPELTFTLPDNAEPNAWTWSSDGAKLYVFCGTQQGYVFNLPAAAATLRELGL